MIKPERNSCRDVAAKGKRWPAEMPDALAQGPSFAEKAGRFTPPLVSGAAIGPRVAGRD
jgi:hypothetical protein